MQINAFWLGVLRGVGYPALMLVLTYFSDVNHLASSGLSITYATIIAGALAGLEHYIEGKTGAAMFGAVRST